MHKAAELERTTIRSECDSIRSCITNYTGFTLVALGGFISLGIGIENEDRALLFFQVSSPILAVVSSLVISLLMYKFNSHNRASGYLKILEHESVGDDTQPIYTWEMCVGRLQHYSYRGNQLGQSPSVQRTEWESEKVIALVNRITQKPLNKVALELLFKWLLGLWLVITVTTGFAKTKSWLYPAYITTLYWWVGLALISISWILCKPNTNVGVTEISLLQLNVVSTVIFFLMWRSFFTKLFELMEGSASVDSFFWRFLPIRGRLLDSFEVEPRYRISSTWLDHSLENWSVSIDPAEN